MSHISFSVVKLKTIEISWSLNIFIKKKKKKQMGINITRGAWAVELHKTSGDNIIASPKGKN
jgi:hypothetical protein